MNASLERGRDRSACPATIAAVARGPSLLQQGLQELIVEEALRIKALAVGSTGLLSFCFWKVTTIIRLTEQGAQEMRTLLG